MRTIYKYPIPPLGAPGFFEVMLRKGATVLDVGIQTDNEEVVLWAEVDTERSHEARRFYAGWTGHELPPGLAYFKTLQIAGLVWHFYSVLE